MPELPEVETLVQDLKKAQLEGIKIKEIHIKWPRSCAFPSHEIFAQKLVHQQIEKIERKGKFIHFTLTTYHLFVHLRMTGKFAFAENHSLLPYERIRLYLEDGRVLVYQDQRKFGKWYLTSHPEEILSKIGIEPLSSTFTLEFFKKTLGSSLSQIKPYLLNQRHIAGIGNIYADEALWEAKIHPLRICKSLTSKEIKDLHKAIINVLSKGVKNRGTTLGSSSANYYSVGGKRGSHQHDLKVFRRDKETCLRCKAPIIKIRVAQKGTHLCPHCQKNL